MDFKYLPSYYNHGFNYITLDTINKTPNAQLDFGNAYYEFVYRVDTNTNWNSTGGNAQAAGWTWTTNNIYNGTGQFEIDMGEIANFGGPGAIAASNYNFGGPNPTYWACPGAAPPSGCPTYTTTAYHTYGMLLTSNGTNQAVCQWVDNNLSSCQNMTPPSGGNNYTADRHFLKMWIGVQNAASISGTVNLYIKSARVWSCANWNDGSQGSPPYTNPNAAAQCNGSNLFNSGGLTYYH
jgi:hypothetical protein